MDTKDYNTCVDTYADGLYRFIVSHLRLEDQAQDVVQEAYLRLWEKHKTIDSKKAKTYLFTTAYHCMIDMTRKNKRLSFNDNEIPNLRSEPTVEPDLQSILHKALDTLPDIQRTVVLLRDYEGYSYEEIGEICQITPSQVKVYIFRARVKMKTYIGKLEKVL